MAKISYFILKGYDGAILLLNGEMGLVVINAEGSDNAFVDLEMAMETFNLFGETTPGAFENTVHAGDLSYIDCGLGNTIYGGNDAGVPCTD